MSLDFTEKPASSIEELQATAKHITDLELWIGHNLASFGIPPSRNLKSLSIKSTMALGAVFNVNMPLEYLPVAIRVDYFEEPIRDEAVMALLGAERSNDAIYQNTFTLNLSFEKWHFAVAHLAACYIRMRESLNEYKKTASIYLLDKYLPMHFPNMSRSQLETLADSGIMSTDAQDRPAELEIIVALYNNKFHNGGPAIPSNLTV